jgi:hypothetical protein
MFMNNFPVCVCFILSLFVMILFIFTHDTTELLLSELSSKVLDTGFSLKLALCAHAVLRCTELQVVMEAFCLGWCQCYLSYQVENNIPCLCYAWEDPRKHVTLS